MIYSEVVTEPVILCKECNKNSINHKRSKNLCTKCLESSKNRTRKWREIHKVEISIKRKLNKEIINNKLRAKRNTEQGKILRKAGYKRYVERHREEEKARQQRWYKENKDHADAYRKQWRKENKERCAQYSKKYRDKNPNAIVLQSQTRRRKIDGTIYKKDWNALCDKYGNKCIKCGDRKNITMDHIIPISKGGTHSLENVQPLCLSCNLEKYIQIADYRQQALVQEWT